MDQFGVLVESIGFKSQGKSTPMADLKGKASINIGFPGNLATNLGSDSQRSSMNRSKSQYNSNSVNEFFVDDLDGIFLSKRETQNYPGYNGYDDIFGGPNMNLKPSESLRGGDGGLMFDLDSVFKDSNSLGANTSTSRLYGDADDIFGGTSGLRSSASFNYDDVFGTMASQPKQSDSIDDLLENFGGMGSKSNGLRKNSGKKEENVSEFDDLITGFGGSSLSSNGMGTQRRTVPSWRSTTKDLVFDALFPDREGSKVEHTSSVTSSGTKKAPSVINIVDDFSFPFGIGAPPSTVEFQKIQGEGEERRRIRLNHYLRTQERMAKALDEKNQRDLKTKREQEERHRLAETLEDDIKRWAAGKEGNLRALLSSLQYVLWPECGWQPVSLSDLITSISVKKVYYKATLCVHPDKVQQKGANLQQKYTAEKVFDLLKEAYKKFSLEEL